MQEQELAKKIREYIKTLYNADFTGLLEVEKLNPEFSNSLVTFDDWPENILLYLL